MDVFEVSIIAEHVKLAYLNIVALLLMLVKDMGIVG